MASLSSLLSVLADKTTVSPSLPPFSKTKNQSSKPRSWRHGINYVPCRASSNRDSNSEDGDSSSKFDRRDVLFGLGGLYGVATTLGSNRSAMADPVTTPNISNCGPSVILDPADGKSVGRVNCCPPSPDEIFDFFPHAVTSKYRVRPAAHLVTKEQIAKFEEAVRRMKQLDPSDPRSFYQQANIHCAYCNVGYEQQGFPGIDLQVHENWLFFPFHRCYLYFFERILGNLINDPTFALPFWNWDAVDGMKMPAIYDNPKSPLYDSKRNPLHRPPTLLNLNYDGDENPPYDVKECNCSVMYRQMVINAKTAEQFLGKPIRAGDPAGKGAGSIENIPHSPIHFWGGDPNSPNGEDLGNFYSAGKDALFYGLHANVDRMWCIWKELGQGKNRDFTDPDWLDSSFVFYDENKNAVRMKVSDCLDTKQLGYVYQDLRLEWLNCKPKPLRPKQLKTITQKFTDAESLSTAAQPSPQEGVPAVTFPLVLSSKITTVVKRPKKSRTKKEKDEHDEILVIEGIQFDRRLPVHFDVLVNVLDDDAKNICPGNTEFAGSFASVPHLHKHKEGEHPKTSLSLGISELIDDLDCDDDDTVLVSLDPKRGAGKITIGGIKIELLSIK